MRLIPYQGFEYPVIEIVHCIAKIGGLPAWLVFLPFRGFIFSEFLRKNWGIVHGHKGFHGIVHIDPEGREVGVINGEELMPELILVHVLSLVKLCPEIDFPA